jgi:putative flippase GtrA
VVQTSVLTGLLQLHVDKSQAWLVGMLTATAVTWALNRRFTFGSSGRRRRHELFRYLLVTGAAQSVSYAMFRMFAFLIPRLPLPIGADLAAVVATDLGAVIATAVSYTGQRFFTFARVDDDGPADPDPKA